VYFPPRVSVADIAITYGVTRAFLRECHDKHLFEPDGSGERLFFRERDQLRLRVILKGLNLGFTLSEIRQMLEISATL
jgi:DNA-binding transcriptional MerR regulator